MALIFHIIALSLSIINFIELKRTSSGRPLSLWIIPLLMIFTTCIPILVIVHCILVLYRQVVKLILKIKYGKRFGGLLNGPEAFHTTSETLKNVLNIMLVYECPKAMSPENFYKFQKERLREVYSLPQFNVIFKEEFGYSYMLKEKSTFDMVFRKMKLINAADYKLSKSELMQLVNEYANSHLPKDNLIPWEVLVGSQPVEWKDDEYNYYFTLFRYHHVLGDGETFMKLTIASYADKKNNMKTSFFKQYPNIIIKLLKQFLALLFIPSWCTSMFVLRGRDRNILKEKKLSSHCHYAMNVENQGDYFQKVRLIKKIIPDVSFSDVLSTAISASLNEFFTKKSAFTPTISVMLPVNLISAELLNLKEAELKDVKFENKFSILTVDLPICINNSPDQFDLITRLHLISKQSKSLRTSFHYSLNRLSLETTCACLPQQWIRYFVSRVMSYTAILSYLPGIPKVTCFNGSTTISDFMVWGTHALEIGSFIAINTYGGHLQITVSIDKALIENSDDVQEIADNILKYLDLLEEEVTKYCAILGASWACLPQQWIRYFISRVMSYTALLSYFPGMPKVTCFNGSTTISDFIVYGSFIAINTYGGHLQITVSIDKALIENPDDVQEIADNILKYLDLLE